MSTIKEKISAIRRNYKKEGIIGVIKKVWVYTLWRSPIAPLLKFLFGDLLHQKLLNYPRVGYWPQINEPQTFNEKLMHRKLFTDRDLYATVSDKYRVRDYVAQQVGDEYLNNMYYVTENPKDIPFDDFPNKFVIKATHGSGWNILVENKQDADFEEIRAQCNEWLSKEYSSIEGEYWYQQITPRIIVEEYIEDEKHQIPLDYKFFVFHGRVEYIQVDFERFSNHKRRVFDRNWNAQEFTLKHPLGPIIEEPYRLDDMITIAEALGDDFDFIRIDLYNPNSDEIIFGEITVAHGSGAEQFTPTKYDFKLGSYW